MSVKDVTRLRHEGKYEEALALAKKELDEESNEWTQISYFWSLHSVCKKLLIPQGKRDEAKQHLSDMEQLLPTMKDDNGIGKKSYESLRKQLLPYADEIRSCSDMAKDKPEEAYNKFSQIPIKEIDKSLYESCGWIIYRYLYAKQTPDADKFTTSELNSACRTYFRLHHEQPSLLHSQVLWAVTRLAKQHDDFRYADFFRKWGGYDSLREEDRTASAKDGHEFTPLAEDCAKLCFKSSKSIGSNDLLQWTKELYERIIEAGSSDPYILRDYAYLCLSVSNDTKKAQDIYGNLVLQKGDQYFIWQEYADLVEDNNTKIGLLLKALSLQPNEDFCGKIRMSLADALIRENFFGEAKHELEKVATHYKNKGWNVPREWQALMNECKDKQDNHKIDRRRYTSLAEDLAYSSLPTRYGYIEYVNEAKRMLHIVCPQTGLAFYKYRKTSLKVGDFVTFKVHEKRILTLRKAERTEALPSFPNCTVVVDNVNTTKELFHFTAVKSNLNAVVKNDKTPLRPNVGDLLRLTYCTNNRGQIVVLDVQPTDN